MNGQISELYAELDRLYGGGDIRRVEEYLLKQLADCAPDLSGRFHPLAVSLYNELGSLYRGMGRYEPSVQAFESAKRMVADNIGFESVEYATILNNIAGTYRLSGDTHRALELFLECASIYERTAGTETPLYCSAINNAALAYQEIKEYTKAEQYLLDVLDRIAGIPDCKQEYAITLGNLASLYLATGQLEKAKDYNHRCIEAYSALDESRQIHLAAAYNTQGKICMEERDGNGAIPFLLRARELTHRNFGKNAEYAVACKNIACAYESVGEYKKALEALGEAKAAYSALGGAESDACRKLTEDIARLEARAENR